MSDYNRRLRVFEHRDSRKTKEKIQEFNIGLEQIHREILENKDRLIKNSSKAEYEFLLQNLEIFYQFIELKKRDDLDTRDRYMAENVTGP